MAAQSAMEYLMTYGWAILIIAVVLAALFELGVFNGSNLAPQACITQAGFTCTNFVYTANGIAFTIGQTTGQDYYGDWVFVASQGEALNASGIPVNFTCTPTGCANAVTVGLPGPNGVRVLVPGQTVTAVFPSNAFPAGAVPSNPPIGTPFAGYIWLGYCLNPCQSPTSFAKVGTVVAKAIGGPGAVIGGGPGGGGGSVLTSNGISYVALTITNTQSSPTPAPFQQKLEIDSAAYSGANEINSGWSNVEFTSGAPAGSGGTALQAWIENNPSNAASDTRVWLYLPNGIPASSSMTVYMNFMPTNVLSNSGPTGEAPQLSCPNPSNTIGCGATYGQYDNGINIFPSGYQNFAGGPGFPLGWSAAAAGYPSPYSVSIDNGLRFTSTGPGGYAWGWYATPYTTGTIEDYDAQSYSGTLFQVGWTTSTSAAAVQGANTEVTGSNGQIGSDIGGSWSYVSGGSSSAQVLTNTWFSQNNDQGLWDYGGSVTATSTGSPGSYLYAVAGMYNAPAGTTVSYWWWVRAYPPNGVMPSCSPSCG